MKISYINWFKEYDINSLVLGCDDYCEVVDYINWMNNNLYRIDLNA